MVQCCESHGPRGDGSQPTSRNGRLLARRLPPGAPLTRNPNGLCGLASIARIAECNRPPQVHGAKPRSRQARRTGPPMAHQDPPATHRRWEYPTRPRRAASARSTARRKARQGRTPTPAATGATRSWLGRETAVAQPGRAAPGRVLLRDQPHGLQDVGGRGVLEPPDSPHEDLKPRPLTSRRWGGPVHLQADRPSPSGGCLAAANVDDVEHLSLGLVERCGAAVAEHPPGRWADAPLECPVA